MENPPTQEAPPRGLFIKRNEPALITIEIGEYLAAEIEKTAFTPQMYLEDRVTYLEQKLKEKSKGLFEVKVTRSAIEIISIDAGYQINDDDLQVINEVLNYYNERI